MRAILLCGLFAAAHTCLAAEPRLRDFREPLGNGAILVGMHCDAVAGKLELAYFYPASPPGRAMDLWRTSDLVSVDSEHMMVVETHALERSCKLGANEYRVRFEGVPGNIHLNGLCGAVTFANAKVWKNGRQVFDQDFEQCEGNEAVRSVTFANGADIPDVRKDTLN